MTTGKSTALGKKKMSLQKLRSEVDRLDRELTRLLNRRIRLTRQIGSLKARNGRKINDPRREKSLLRSLVALNRGPLEARELSDIYRVIFRTSRRHQRKIRHR